MGETQWTVERRRYLFEDEEDGIAERVRAERHDGTAWVRILEAIYWWPTHEGKQWPAEVIPIPVWGGGDTPPADAWTHFEITAEIGDRHRWESLPVPPDRFANPS